MSQAVAEVQVRELKMNDPKLNKIFDKLKKGDKIKLKTSSTMSRGSDFVEYIVKSKNVVNKGRVEKITLATVGNEGAVKKFLYRRDGKVTFAMGDMAASIDDIKEEVIDEIVVEEVELDEKRDMSAPPVSAKVVEDEGFRLVMKFKDGTTEALPSLGKPSMQNLKRIVDKNILKNPKRKAWIPVVSAAMKKGPVKEEVELGEKYELYHKTFSDAMQHAYDYAKKKLGITVDPKEIDDKVATGPKKPSEGKTNKYRLKGKGGNLQIQVYNKGGSKPFELNMYKEDLDKEDEPVVKKVVDMLKKASQAHAGQAKDLEKAVKEGKMRVYRVSSRKLQGNIHAKDEKEAEKIARSKGMKGKLTITDRGEYRGQPRLTMGEGTWKYPENRSEIDALKKLMARPIRLGREGEGAVVAMQGLLGDDELFDDFYLDGKKNENGDARKTIIKWFRNRVKKDTFGLGDETRELGKKIGLKMSFVPEENNMTEKLTDGNLSLKETVLKMWQEAKSPEQQAAIAIAKKEKEKKEEPDEGNKFSGELDKARKAGKKTFKVGDKEYKVEPKKEEFSWPEYERYLETKKGSLRESILNIWSEELDEGKMKQFHMMVDDGKTAEEIAKAMKLDLKTVKSLMPKKENKNLTKEQENGKKKMTDTGKEMTPVDLSPKMPKIKNEKNRV